MLPEQQVLLGMSMQVVASSLLGCVIAAWLCRNVLSWGLIGGGFIITIMMIFACFWAAESESMALVLFVCAIFGATSGCTLGGFTNAVLENHPRAKEALGLTLGAVAVSTFAAALVGMFSGYDFQSLGSYLFTGLLILIGIGIVQFFVRVSEITDLLIGAAASIFWVVYLIYDFNKVVDKYYEATWTAAVDIGMNIYLNMVNLFIRLLPIIAKALD